MIKDIVVITASYTQKNLDVFHVNM